MFTLSIEKVNEINPLVADAIKLSEESGDTFKSAYYKKDDGWAIAFQGLMSRHNIKRFLDNSAKAVNRDSSEDHFDIDNNSEVINEITVIYIATL